MSKLKVLILLSVLLCGCSNKSISSSNNASRESIPPQPSISQDNILNTINSISSEERPVGSNGEIKTSQYLSNQLKSSGYNVEIEEFPVYEQVFDLVTNEPKNLNPLNKEPYTTGKNIVATSPNYNPKNKTIYLTAHYDSGSNTVGVIDNATGTACLLEIAKAIQDYPLPFNLKIVFFSAEEKGIYGSRYYVSNLTSKERENIIANINIDMLGEKDAGNIVMKTSMGKNNALSILLNKFSKNKFKLLQGSSSDEFAFYIGEIPSITLCNEFPKTFDGDNQFDYLDINQLTDISEFVTNFIINFDMDTYYNIIKSKTAYKAYNYSEEFMQLNNFKLLSVQETLLPNGFDSSSNYVYSDSESNEYTLIERDNRFINIDDFTDFVILNNNNNYAYKVVSTSPNSTEIIYIWGGYYGILKSNTNLTNSKRFLNTYYNKYFEYVFGEKPDKQIL